MSASGSGPPGRFDGVVHELCEAHPTRWLLLLAGVVYLPWLGAEPVYTTLEGLRMVPAREMLATGDWVVPRLNGDPYLAKPPLVYWAIATLSAPIGDVTIVSGRLVSVLSMIGTMLLVAAFGRRHLGPRAGFLAAVITGFAALAFEKGSRAELEALLLVTSTGGLLALYEACRSPRHRARATLLAGLGIGLAILTKGPVPLIAFATAGAALVAVAESRLLALRTVAAAGALALLVCVPWVAALFSTFEQGELSRVLQVEVFQRVESADAVNEEPFYYYLVALARGMAPWSLLLPGLAVLAQRDARTGKGPLFAFLMAWSVATLLALSISSGKETRYLLPTYPAWALLVAWGWCERRRLPGLQAYGRILLNGLLVASWGVPLALPVVAYQIDPELLPVGLALAAVMLAGRAAIALGVRRDATAIVLAGLFVMLFALRGGWAEIYWPTRAPGYPYVEIAAGVDERMTEGAPLVALGRVSASLLYHLDRPLLRVKSADDLAACRMAGTCVATHVISDRPLDDASLREVARWPTRRAPFRLYAASDPRNREDPTKP